MTLAAVVLHQIDARAAVLTRLRLAVVDVHLARVAAETRVGTVARELVDTVHTKAAVQTRRGLQQRGGTEVRGLGTEVRGEEQRSEGAEVRG